MAKGNRKGRHPKRKGPGGPSRPTRLGSPTPPGRPELRVVPDDDPMVPLVTSLIEGFIPLHHSAEAADVVMMEGGAAEIFDMFMSEPGPHLRAMLTAAGAELARRRTPTTDALLALLSAQSIERGRRELADAWRRRSAEPDVLPAAFHHGADTVVEALEIDHVQGDGVNLVLAVENPAGDYTVATYIDHNLGGMAKDLLVGPPLANLRARLGKPEDGFLVRSVPLPEAYWRFQTALDSTEQTFDPPVSEDFEDLLPIVEQRFDLLAEVAGPEPTEAPWRQREVSNAERLAHVAAFMASPEYAEIPADQADEAVGVVRLWIDHTVGYTVGPVRRVSPTLVDIFCTGWFPAKVVADEEMLAAAPAAIGAWLRFAARTTELDDRWRDEALDALDRFAPHLRRALDDPGSWGMAKGLLGPALGASGSRTTTAIDRNGDLVTTSTSAFERPDDGPWEPLEVTETGAKVHVEADPSGVHPWQYAKTRIIAGQASVQAGALLGPSFAQPAMDLAVALGSVDPSPYDNSQMRSWPGTIVWLLAEDNDAFEPRTSGRRRDDLAAELPMTRATYQTKANKIRDALDLEDGECKVPHRPTRT